VDENDEELKYAIVKSIMFKKSLGSIKAKCNRTLKRFLSSEIEREGILNAFKATVIFGQYEAGTGVIIDSIGVVLTCAHCLGENPKVGTTKFLILHDGRLCSAEAIKVDNKRDTASMKIVTFLDGNGLVVPRRNSLGFPCVRLSPVAPNVGDPLLCIG
jgi:S1-C subfamily serine protease